MSEWTRLGTCAVIQKGKPPMPLGGDGKNAEPYLNPEYLRGRSSAVMARARTDSVRAHSGDTVLLWDGSNAGEFFRAKVGLVASTMARISQVGSFRSDYFFHALKNSEHYLRSQTNGTGIPHVDREVLESITLFCPDSEVQGVVATVLDTLDTAIQETAALIAKLKAVKQGLLHDLLTRGIDANGELRPLQSEAPHLYKPSPLGLIPNAWNVEPLSRYTASEITYGIVQAGPHIPGGVPYIRTGDMSGDSLIRETMLCTSRRIANSYMRSKVRAGEVVMAIRATVGRVLPVPDDLDGANLTQGTARISPSIDTDGVFLLWALRHTRALKAINLEIKGTTFAEITLNALRRILLAAPLELEEQIEMGRRLNAIDRSIMFEYEILAKRRAQKFGLMNDLLTGRVRVTPLLDATTA